jgi:hypothetical protein
MAKDNARRDDLPGGCSWPVKATGALVLFLVVATVLLLAGDLAMPPSLIRLLSSDRSAETPASDDASQEASSDAGEPFEVWAYEMITFAGDWSQTYYLTLHGDEHSGRFEPPYANADEGEYTIEGDIYRLVVVRRDTHEYSGIEYEAVETFELVREGDTLQGTVLTEGEGVERTDDGRSPPEAATWALVDASTYSSDVRATLQR